MPNLKEVVKVTATQMETLINGGTVGGHTLADDVLYAVERTGSLIGPTGPQGPTGPRGLAGVAGVSVGAISKTTYYGFDLGSDGYYWASNSYIDDSAAVARISFYAAGTGNLVLDYVSNGENNFDFLIFGKLDTPLSTDNTVDTNIQHSCKGESSAAVKQVTWSNISAGSHFVDIKYRKDTSTSTDPDTGKFKLNSTSTVIGAIVRDGANGPTGPQGPTGANGVGVVTSLNGSTGTDRSIYAPISGGTSGYYLRSNGNAAPTWSIVKIDDGTL